ncbi:hypothetical protein DFP73DRAFT_178055 [Morchella snyderi]|nr:hypothetical protein DFP73DRAFT_178055 [Morchella snyderi]
MLSLWFLFALPTAAYSALPFPQLNANTPFFSLLVYMYMITLQCFNGPCFAFQISTNVSKTVQYDLVKRVKGFSIQINLPYKEQRAYDGRYSNSE